MVSTLCLQKCNCSNNCGGLEFGEDSPACWTEHFQLSDFKTAEDKSIEVALLLDLIEIRPRQGLGCGVWQLCMCSEQYSVWRRKKKEKSICYACWFLSTYFDTGFSHSKHILNVFLVKYVDIRSTKQADFKLAVFESKWLLVSAETPVKVQRLTCEFGSPDL